jgi:hypothetical protein
VHQLFIDFKETYDSLGGQSCVLFSLNLVSHETGKAIKNVSAVPYNKVWVGKHLFDMFPIKNGLKQGDALSPLLCIFAIEFVIRLFQANRDGLI